MSTITIRREFEDRKAAIAAMITSIEVVPSVIQSMVEGSAPASGQSGPAVLFTLRDDSPTSIHQLAEYLGDQVSDLEFVE